MPSFPCISKQIESVLLPASRLKGLLVPHRTSFNSTKSYVIMVGIFTHATLPSAIQSCAPYLTSNKGLLVPHRTSFNSVTPFVVMTGILASIRFLSAPTDALHFRTSHCIAFRDGSTQRLASSP